MSYDGKMRKYAVLFVAFLLLFLSTAGCIDIFLARDLFAPRDEKETIYVTRTYPIGNYSFTVDIANLEIDTFNEEFTHIIKPLTQSMRFSIDVFMRSADEVVEIINNSPLPDDLKDPVLEFLEQALMLAGQRYVEVTITSPEGIEMYNNKFNVTAEDELFLYGPSDGDWTVHVEGAGVGFDEFYGFKYHDEFNIDVTVHEPLE